MKYTLLGSLGHISSIVAPALVKAGNTVTVISSNEKRAEQIRQIGAIPAIGDMQDAEFLTKQFTGADAVYVMLSSIGGPTGSVFESTNAQGAIFAKAVQQAGVTNVVDLSSIGADNPDAGVVYAYHLIEDQLRALPNVNVAFVRPVGFYSNLYSNMDSIKNEHAIYSNIPADVKRRWVAPEDIAAVVEKLLLHVPQGKTIHYVYSDEFTTTELIDALKQALELPDLHFVPITDEQTRQAMVARGVPENLAQLFVQMSVFERDSEKVYGDLKNEPTTVGTFKLADFVREFKQVYEKPDMTNQSNTFIDK